MTEPTDTVAAPTSELQETMVAAGAMPADVDVAALMAQMKALQDRVDSLSVAAGIPSDPIAAAVKNVRDHLDSRVAMNPYRREEFAELLTAVTQLSDSPDSKDTDLVRTLLVDLLPFEGIEYMQQLSRDLHKAVLKG